MLEKRRIIQTTGLSAGIILFIVILLTKFPSGTDSVNQMTAVAILMAIWWMTEAIPLAATSLLPLFLFPLLGILPVEKVSGQYINSTIFLFLGGFILAIAMEKWSLHKRVSLFIMKSIGGNARTLILGLMLAAALISMLISNTATAIIMMPIGMAICIKVEEEYEIAQAHQFATVIMLGIAYASSIGGIATLIGTVPNLVLQRIFSISFPQAPSITFSKWLFFGLPTSLIMLAAIWSLLVFILFRKAGIVKIDKHFSKEQYKNLGKLTREELIVLIIMISTAVLWIFRSDLVIGNFIIPGWSNLINLENKIDDSTIAVFMALLLFLIPVKNNKGFLLDTSVFGKIPWDIILLFGGGFALAAGFQSSGLSAFIGSQFKIFSGASVFVLLIIVCFIMTFLTELTSNTAVTNTMLPILASLAVAIGINPLILMLPATISASFAFMLPVATPPNAIVFSTGKIKIGDMVKSGFYINLIGVLVVTFSFLLIGTNIFGIDINIFPEWAKISNK